jgi:signal transduction histidine kinase
MAEDSVPTQPNATPQRREFTAVTCGYLVDLILEQASTGPHVEPGPLGQLTALCDRDLVFADWYKQNSQWVCAGSLSQALTSDPSWYHESVESKRLWQIANLTLRLESISRRFDQAIEVQMRKAVYELAYGLSHELNNPLANIATRAGVLVHEEASAHRRQLLETIIDNAMRGSEMIGDLMLIARPPKLNLQSVDVARWCSQFADQSKSWAAKREINVQWNHEYEPLPACFDPVAIKEALWCLVRNAIEASNPGGTVTLIVADSCRGKNNSGLIFRVLDNGAGLSPYALEHCFDLYYSGREAGRGLGMGLAKARRIAELHGGQVTLTNRPEGGCEGSLKFEVR